MAEHPDAEQNRNYAKTWLALNGSTRRPLEIYMAPDGNVVWFCLTPKKFGNIANPFSVHQPFQNFKRGLDETHKHFLGLKQRYE